MLARLCEGWSDANRCGSRAPREGHSRRPRNARWATAQAALTGKLATPDLPFTDELLDDDGLVDDEKVQVAVDDLIARKPHLTARRRQAMSGRQRSRRRRRSGAPRCCGEVPNVRVR